MPYRRAHGEGDPSGLGWLLVGVLLGLMIGGVAFTRLGRELAVYAIRRGAAVAEEKVREWLRRGEAE